MKKRIFTTSIIMLGLTLTLLWLPGPLFGQPKYEKEILVFFSSGVERAESGQPPVVSSQGVQQVLNKFGISRQDVQPAFPEFNERDTVIIMPDGRRVNRPNMARIFRILVADPTDREMLIQDLKLLENVGFAELNGRADVDVVPNDEYYSFQWSLQEGGGIGRIQAPEAWDIYTGNSTTKIAIIDLGVDGTHPDLSGKFSGHTTIFDHHGTHVAGIAAAKTNNLQVGIAGVDWNAQILAKSFIDGSESGDPYLYQIIMEAVNEGSHVLNNSWRLAPTGRYSTTVRIAFANAYKLNRVSTATIGNTGPTENIVQYPGSFAQGIIAVGSTSSQDVVSDFSTRGNSIDVAAPGEDILSTY